MDKSTLELSKQEAYLLESILSAIQYGDELRLRKFMTPRNSPCVEGMLERVAGVVDTFVRG